MPSFTGSLHAFFPPGSPLIQVTVTFTSNPTQTLPFNVGDTAIISGASHSFFNGSFPVSAVSSVNGVNDAVSYIILNAIPGSGNTNDNNVILMSTVKCDLNTLQQTSKCFSCFSEIENQAALVYFLNQRLAALQGVTAQTPNQLRQTAACIACTRPESVADNLDTAVAQAGAVNAGVAGAASQTVAQIKKAALPFRNMSLSELRAIEVILRCQLNAFP